MKPALRNAIDDAECDW